MADISHINLRRYGTQSSPYDPEAANEPIDDLKTMVDIVNEESEATSTEVEEARGDMDTLADRLDVTMNPDGTLKPDSVSDVPIENVVEQTTGDKSDLVLVTRGDLDKLKSISNRANFTAIKVGDSSEIDGIIRLVAGSTVKLTPILSSDGTTAIRVDTIFSGDRIHEHRTFQDCTIYSQGIAYIPNKDDFPIPGTMAVYLNGQLLARSDFDEHVDQATGRVDGTRIKTGSDSINITSDKLWFEYRIRPAAGQSNQAPELNRMSFFSHDLRTSDLREIYLPMGSSAQNLYSFWLVKLPEEVKAPYSGMLLFISEDAYPHETGPKGLTARRYGQDWDVVTMGGKNFIRWRFDQVHPIDGPSSMDDPYAYLTQTGAGTTSKPVTSFAPINLVEGARLMLFY